MFSFYPTKNMTSGEGGMVTTADAEIARTVRLLRNQGMEKRYENEVVGFNTRMTDIHAAIGRVQLTKARRLDRDSARPTPRSSTRTSRASSCPPVAEGAAHVYHQYTIRVAGTTATRFVAALREEHQVGSGVYYPTPNHRLPSFAHYAPGLTCPRPSAAAARSLSLPVHPSLTQADLDRIVAAVNAVAKAGA